MIEGIAFGESHNLYDSICRCEYTDIRDHRDLLPGKVLEQSAVGIEQNELLQPETRRIIRKGNSKTMI